MNRFFPLWSPRYTALLPRLPQGNTGWKERVKTAMSNHLWAQVGGVFSVAFLAGQVTAHFDRQNRSISAEETKQYLESSKDMLTSVGVGIAQILGHLEELKKSNQNLEIQIREMGEKLKGLQKP